MEFKLKKKSKTERDRKYPQLYALNKFEAHVKYKDNLAFDPNYNHNHYVVDYGLFEYINDKWHFICSVSTEFFEKTMRGEDVQDETQKRISSKIRRRNTEKDF